MKTPKLTDPYIPTDELTPRQAIAKFRTACSTLVDYGDASKRLAALIISLLENDDESSKEFLQSYGTSASRVTRVGKYGQVLAQALLDLDTQHTRNELLRQKLANEVIELRMQHFALVMALKELYAAVAANIKKFPELPWPSLSELEVPKGLAKVLETSKTEQLKQREKEKKEKEKQEKKERKKDKNNKSKDKKPSVGLEKMDFEDERSKAGEAALKGLFGIGGGI